MSVRASYPGPISVLETLTASGDVCPSLTENDGLDGAALHPMFLGNGLPTPAVGNSLPDCPHGRIGEFRDVAPFSAEVQVTQCGGMMLAARQSSLVATVPVVIGLRAEKEVGRVATGGVVARVADTEAGRDGAAGDNPGDTVGRLWLCPESELPIAFSVPACCPRPAVVRT